MTPEGAPERWEDMHFAEAARACVAGEIEFARFVEETDRRWQWWAKRLSRAGIPVWLDVEDIRQELLVEAWRAMKRFDGKKAKNVSESQWTERAAKEHAKKQVHRARGDDRHTWAWGPPRFDIPVSALLKDGADEDAASIFDVPVEPEQDRARERAEAVMQLARQQESMRDFFAVQALAAAEGDVEYAAKLFWEDLDARLLCRLPSDHTARMIVGRVAARLAA